MHRPAFGRCTGCAVPWAWLIISPPSQHLHECVVLLYCRPGTCAVAWHARPAGLAWLHGQAAWHACACADPMPAARTFAPGALHLAAARQCRAARRSSPRHDATPAPAHALRTRVLAVQLPSMPWPAKSAVRAAACLFSLHPSLLRESGTTDASMRCDKMIEFVAS